jgi:hypothetical protein
MPETCLQNCRRITVMDSVSLVLGNNEAPHAIMSDDKADRGVYWCLFMRQRHVYYGQWEAKQF